MSMVSKTGWVETSSTKGKAEGKRSFSFNFNSAPFRIDIVNHHIFLPDRWSAFFCNISQNQYDLCAASVSVEEVKRMAENNFRDILESTLEELSAACVGHDEEESE